MSKVKVFSTATCPWCTKVKDYLSSIDIAYDSVDVGADKTAAMEMVKKTRQMGVPVTQIGEKYIVGFDKAAIDEALSESGLK